MKQIVKFSVLANYHILIVFQDGVEKTVDFRPFIGEGFTKTLLDPAYFATVFIESGGGLAWDNDFDFCPNFLYDYETDLTLV
jgi:hypothetical protein